MIKLKDIPEDELRTLSEEYKIKPEILNNLLTEWNYSLFLGEDNIGNPNETPSDSETRTHDWAVLSKFYYDNKSIKESEYPFFFKKVVFTPRRSDFSTLEFSDYFATQILFSYLKKLKKRDKILNESITEEILKKKKRGKKPEYKIVVRDDLIKSAAFYLKSQNIKSYAPIICRLLSLMGIAEMQPGTIRQIIKRS